ncbi:MAG TPA: UrcA family protein [Hyphomonadaceae bacterium]|jgi:UrcA family protein|nr:UrcA family protein [Hyphomonadaceae bacterium]
MSATLKIAFAALALSALAPAAFADQPERISFRVGYGDLNMSAPSAGHTLLGRIEQAAYRVCDDATPRSALFRRKAIECRRQTIANTVRSLDFPTLSVAWNGKYAATVLAAR